MAGFRLSLTLLLMAFFTMTAGCNTDAPPSRLPVIISGRTFQLELALDDATRIKGLSGRDHLDADGGMIFVFPGVARRRFWMKDCLVPIDIIFLDPAGRVMAMHRMVPEPGVADADLKAYSSNWPAQFAIELRGGALDELSVKPQQTIALPLADLKRWAD